MNRTASESREVETVLVVVGAEPKRVLERVAELRELGGCRLVPLSEQALEDTYYDRPARSLRQGGVALRLRRVDGELRLTLKSDLRQHGGVSDRLEFEGVWSRESFAEALTTLRRVDAEFREKDGVFRANAPSTLELLGLEPVQHRRTRRVRRLVIDDDGRPLAELALDSVVFDELTGPIRLFEVELEARSPDADVGEFARVLAHCPSLRPWPYGKLATGLAAARIAASGDLARLSDGTLTATAFDQLADELDALG